MPKLRSEIMKEKWDRADRSGEVMVEKGIPLPKLSRNPPKYRKYPFSRMEVGDSFFVAVGEEEIERIEKAMMSKLASLITSARRCKSGKFSARRVWDEEKQRWGVRIWRIE